MQKHLTGVSRYSLHGTAVSIWGSPPFTVAVWEDFQEVDGSEFDGENSKASNREHLVRMPDPRMVVSLSVQPVSKETSPDLYSHLLSGTTGVFQGLSDAWTSRQQLPGFDKYTFCSKD